MTRVGIRHLEQDDHHPIILLVDEWWGGWPKAAMLPNLVFVPFSSASFTAVDGGSIVGFLIAFVSQAFLNQTSIHFLGVHPARRGERLGCLLH